MKMARDFDPLSFTKNNECKCMYKMKNNMFLDILYNEWKVMLKSSVREAFSNVSSFSG